MRKRLLFIGLIVACLAINSFAYAGWHNLTQAQRNQAIVNEAMSWTTGSYGNTCKRWVQDYVVFDASDGAVYLPTNNGSFFWNSHPYVMILKNIPKNKFLLIVLFFSFLIATGLYIKLNFIKESNVDHEALVSRQRKIKYTDIRENIKNAFLQKFPDWKKENFDLLIDEESPGYAIGTLIWKKNNGECFWLAAEVNNNWNIAYYGCGGYFGICQDFEKYNFPPDMTPDCWDEEKKVLVNTRNPDKFYNGLTAADKTSIKQAFLGFNQENRYDNKELYVKFNEIVDNYLKGVILVGGVENYSAPYFLAVKENENWKVLYYGQEDPPCKNINLYNFPTEMISGCWDDNNWIKR